MITTAFVFFLERYTQPNNGRDKEDANDRCDIKTRRKMTGKLETGGLVEDEADGEGNGGDSNGYGKEC